MSDPKKPSKVAVAPKPAPENMYQAQYVGSGTFLIKKPKRNKTKLHQSRVKNIRGGRI